VRYERNQSLTQADDVHSHEQVRGNGVVVDIDDVNVVVVVPYAASNDHRIHSEWAMVVLQIAVVVDDIGDVNVIAVAVLDIASMVNIRDHRVHSKWAKVAVVLLSEFVVVVDVVVVVIAVAVLHIASMVNIRDHRIHSRWAKVVVVLLLEFVVVVVALLSEHFAEDDIDVVIVAAVHIHFHSKDNYHNDVVEQNDASILTLLLLPFFLSSSFFFS
jgi:hypothetical protein